MDYLLNEWAISDDSNPDQTSFGFGGPHQVPRESPPPPFDDYFELGKRVEPWMERQVTKYHRTTEYYVQALVKAGFTIEGLKEGEPLFEHFDTKEEYERRKRIPLVLILSARKQ